MLNRNELILRIVLLGLGATAFMDLWAIAADALFGVPQSNFALVGRWLGHMPDGMFVHDSIRKVTLVTNEAALGWTAHYIVGVIFAAVFVALAGERQLLQPGPIAPIVFGLITVVAPFFILQPALGLGIMAANKPNPDAARLKSLMSHFSFGLGLYIAAYALSRLMPKGRGSVSDQVSPAE
ncbi:DUF2938 domain-containing protein [Phaeobacter porticola]|uniref:DUF2938 domain-containing protein n=1 Tax=Phaeobacter porticola TaxID=1844006 RepID=UPI00093200CC|nr:DUF2938 domain-containing protein [Phaeobacter porticola]